MTGSVISSLRDWPPSESVTNWVHFVIHPLTAGSLDGDDSNPSSVVSSNRSISSAIRRRGVVCSAKWVVDGYTFDVAPLAHILGERLAAAERASGSYHRRVAIRQPVYHLDLQCVDHNGWRDLLHLEAEPGRHQPDRDFMGKRVVIWSAYRRARRRARLSTGCE